jgi:hypothetical protein
MERRGKIQSVLFPRNKYTIAQAKKWLFLHKFKHNKIDATDKFYRFRQRAPKLNHHYFIVKLSSGVEFVLYYPNK